MVGAETCVTLGSLCFFPGHSHKVGGLGEGVTVGGAGTPPGRRGDPPSRKWKWRKSRSVRTPAARRRLARVASPSLRAPRLRPARRPHPHNLSRGGSLPRPHCKRGRPRLRIQFALPPPALRPPTEPPALSSRVLPAARTHSMTFRCFVSRPFSMENQQDRAMIATGSFEEWDAFKEA